MSSNYLVLFLCVCVLAQMLGMPITFFSLVASSDASLMESVSEDFSFPPTIPKPTTSSAWSSNLDRQSLPYVRVFVTSVFHPPQA